MTLITTKEILRDAYQNHYAIGAFGAHNHEIIKAVISGAEEMGAPVILQTTPGTIKYVGIENISVMVKAAAEKAKIPVALHLDHGTSFEMVMKCLRAGYTSVMIDGSHLPLDENIVLVKKVVDAAQAIDIPVEAELGTIGGVEDDLTVNVSSALFTDPITAEHFVQETGITSFAPAFGTAHGMYRDEPELRFDLLDEIYQRTDCPLVMHGASGVSAKSVQNSMKYGIAKVNFSTELKDVFAKELRQYFHENPSQNDPRKYFLSASNAVKEIVKTRIGTLQNTRTLNEI